MPVCEQSSSPWLTRPLCRRYVLGYFDGIAVRVHDASGVCQHSIRWALGWLLDGECEALGAWIDPPKHFAGLRQTLADLKSRGVERIWNMAGSEIVNLDEEVLAFAPGMKSPSSLKSNIPRALAESRWSGAHIAALEVEGVRKGLVGAVRRRGTFESKDAALAFMARALERAERRLDRERCIAKVSPRDDLAAQLAPPIA